MQSALQLEMMMKTFYPVGYSAVGYSHERFSRMCQSLASELPDLLEKVGAQAVVVRGTSGYCVAFGVRALTDLVPFVIARKEGERSHSSLISAAQSDPLEVESYIIVDDMIDSGATITGILRDMAGTRCAAVLVYQSFDFGRVIAERELDPEWSPRVLVENGIRLFGYRSAQ